MHACNRTRNWIPGKQLSPRARSSDRHLISLDHRIREQFLAHLEDTTPRLVGIGGVERQLDELTDAHIADARISECRERTLDRLTLRVGNSVLEHDVDTSRVVHDITRVATMSGP